MAIAQRALQPVWPMRLVEDLNASDERAEKLVDGLGEDQLNWQPPQGCWSVGQCLEHLCITNETYLPAISAALKGRPDEPVEQIIPGWVGGWFIRTFIEPSPQGQRAPAPAKIRPVGIVGLSVLDRFLSSNDVCRTLIADARYKNVNRVRFWNPLFKGIRFTVGTGLEIIAGHQRRHLLQAERVRKSTNFPRCV
jgi:DinB superfamily